MSGQSRDEKSKGYYVLDEADESEREKSRDEALAQNLALEAEIKALRERMVGHTGADSGSESPTAENPAPEPQVTSEKPLEAPALPASPSRRNLEDIPRRPSTPFEKSQPANEELKNENERLRREINGLNAKVSAVQNRGSERIKTLRQRLTEVEKKRQALSTAMADLERELADFGKLLKDDQTAGPALEASSSPTGGSRPKSAPGEKAPGVNRSNVDASPSRWKSNKPF